MGAWNRKKKRRMEGRGEEGMRMGRGEGRSKRQGKRWERKESLVALEMCMLLVTVVMGPSDILCHGSYLCLSNLIVSKRVEFPFI